MTAPLKVIELPVVDVSNVLQTLRNLADQIEEGKFGDAHNVAWVCDCGDNRIEIGLCGSSPEPGATGHFLFGLAMRILENSVLEAK